MRSSSSFVAIALTLVGCAAQADGDETKEPAPQAAAPAPNEPAARVPGSGSTEGAFGGTSMAVAEAVVLAGSLSANDATRRGARIVLTTDASACGRVDTVRAGGATISFDIDYVKGQLVAGTYSVPGAFAEGPDSVFAQLDSASATCQRKTVVAQAGTVTIASIEGGRIRGTFAMTTGHETIKGSFDAAPCGGSAAAPPRAVRCER